MENYDLDESEVVLYKGDVTLKDQKGITQLILTNINFVFITKVKKMFAKDEVIVDVYSADEIKFYNQVPQVLKRGNVIELYFLHSEIEFVFSSGNECRKFMDAALKLLTHKNKFERVAGKVMAARQCVDSSFNIDSVGMVKSAAKGAIEHKSVIGKTFGVIKNIGFGKKKDK